MSCWSYRTPGQNGPTVYGSLCSLYICGGGSAPVLFSVKQCNVIACTILINNEGFTYMKLTCSSLEPPYLEAYQQFLVVFIRQGKSSLASRPYFFVCILLHNREEMGLVNCLYRFCSEPYGSWGSLIFSNHGNNDIHGKVVFLQIGQERQDDEF